MICPCGSKKESWILTDVLGISCGWVCDDCEAARRGKYRPETFSDAEDYRRNAAECGEEIEPDNWW